MDEIKKIDLSDEQISEMLRGLDDDIQVPLDVSAAWRRAVRKEAGSVRMASILRKWGSLAAALILLTGLTAIWRGAFGTNAKHVEFAPERTNPYIYFVDETTTQTTLLASDSSLDDALLFRTVEDNMEAEFGDPNEEVDSKKLTAGKSEAGNGMAAPEIVKYANADIYARDVAKTHAELHALVKNFDAYIESEEKASDENENSANGRIRVRADQFEEMTESIKNAFPSIELNVFKEDISAMYRDGSERLEAAYRAIDELNKRLETAQADSIGSLYDEINRMYDEIDLYRGEQNAFLTDTQYSTVFYSIREKNALGGLAAFFSPAQTEGTGGFILDMLKLSVMLLPLIALTVYLSLRYADGRHRKKTYSQIA